MRKHKRVTTAASVLLFLNLLVLPHTLFDNLTSFGLVSEEVDAIPGWLSGYGYRKQLLVAGSTSGEQTNYTITITAHYGNGIDSGRDVYLNGKVNKNFQDVRFTKEDGLTLLECNRDEWAPGDKATFSLMIPNIPASPTKTTLYIYSDNSKVSWKKYSANPVLSKGSHESWESESVRDISIVWNGSHYVGFYQGMKHPIVGDPDYETAIGMAFSTDGISWTKYSGNPVLAKAGTTWESRSVGIPDVLYVNGTYHLWYGARGAGPAYSGYHVGYANSSDGINWNRGPNNPILTPTAGKFDAEGIYGHGTVYNGTHYVMIFNGWSIGIRTGIAISNTPWHVFTKINGGNPVMTYDEAWECDEAQINDLVLINNTYYGAVMAGHGNVQMQLGMVKSTNLINWVKDNANPILENWAGTFDSQQLHDPNLLQMQNGDWRVYYSGASTGGNYGNFDIGFAETKFKNHPPLISEFEGSPINNGDNAYEIFSDFDKSRSDDGSKEGFNVKSGVWTVEEEKPNAPFGEANFFYEGYGLRGTATSLYNSKNKNQADFAIEVRARLAFVYLSLGNYSIIFRWQDSDNYYKIQYVEALRGEDDRLALTKVMGGNNTEITSFSLTTDREWHTMKIVVNDTNCKVFFDDTQRIPSSGWQSLGSEFLSGKIGFQIESALAHFDDLKIYKYIEPEPSVIVLGMGEVISEGALFAIIFPLILIILVFWIVKKRRGKGAIFDHTVKTEIDDTKRFVGGVQGWLTDKEGELLYNLARNCTGKGVIVEIGSWKGKSTIWLGKGSKRGNKVKIYAIDPHAGIDWKEFPEFKDDRTFEEFKKNIKSAKVDDIIIPIVKTSEETAKKFDKPVELIFVDGSHEYEIVRLDFELWFPKLIDGGIMAFHDTLIHQHPGPQKVVDELVYKSKYFRNVGFVDSISFAEKVRQNSMKDSLRNRYVLLLKNRHEFADRLHLPKQIRFVGKNLMQKVS